MLKRALDLWSAGRIIERLWRVCGDDKLGLDVIWDPANPWNGIIPIPPIMDPQLDQLVIQGYLIPLKNRLLQELQAKINKKSKEHFFEIYLTIFVLLSNAEQMLAHTRRFAKRFGMSVCGARPPFQDCAIANSQQPGKVWSVRTLFISGVLLLRFQDHAHLFPLRLFRRFFAEPGLDIA
jgi:hypothetical protein